MELRKYQLFSVEDGEFRYLGLPLDRRTIDDTAQVLDSHVAKNRTERALYERMIFCISSQFLTYERACEFVKSMRDEPLKRLKDPVFVMNRAAGHIRFKSTSDRYLPIFDFAKNYAGGIEGLANDLLSNPKAMRHSLDKDVNWVAYKTASFMHLCFGGKELMTLDIHNLRQIAGIGINVKDAYYLGRVRQSGLTKGMRIQVTPSKKDYDRIEEESLKLISDLDLPNQFPEFRNPDGSVNAAFATALFWWAGAQARRMGTGFFQGWLFEDNSAPVKFESPFSE